MNRSVSATEARVNFGAMLDRVVREEEPIIVRRGAHPVAVLLSYETYKELAAQAQRTVMYRALDEAARVRERTAAELDGLDEAILEKAMDQDRRERDRDLDNLR